MTPEEYCREKAAKSGSSFYYAFLFLPPPRRAAITALYAFCREVDDVVDEVTDPSLAATKLAWWRSEVDRLYAGKPTHPVTRALAPHVVPFSIAREHLLEIIEGWRWTSTRRATSTSPACALLPPRRRRRRQPVAEHLRRDATRARSRTPRSWAWRCS